MFAQEFSGMNKKELLEEILNQKEVGHIAKKDAEALLNQVIVNIKDSVKKGEEVSLVGFGTFTKSERAARTGINPATGEKIQIKAKTLPKFRPGKAFKDFL